MPLTVKRRRISIVVMALAVVVFGAAAVYASMNSPAYFVDGARPNGDITSGSGVPKEGCVPYSAEREDVVICGSSVPDDYQPPPLPYFDELKCARAESWIDDQRESMAAGGATEEQVAMAWPHVIPSSCLIDEGAPAGKVIVTFVSAPGEDRRVITVDSWILEG